LPPLIERLIAFAPCCKKHQEAVGRFPSQANRSKQPDAAIATLTQRVEAGRLRDRVEQLVEFRTRWSLQAGVARVPEWIHNQLTGMGYPAGAMTRFQEFQFPGSGPQRNVLCGPGDLQRGFVLICAHYDSLSEQPAVSAPGADDNASGVAAVLELAELLKDHSLKRGLLFAFFGGEEQGLFGSQACAKAAAREGWPIDLVINLDMVGHRDVARPPRIVVEYDQGNRHPGNDAAAKAYGLLMAQAAADYTSLEVEHTDIWNSDYMPFEAKGYACIGAFEGGENPFYHRSTDTLATVDIS
jgi:acetylornithine deacetylase/succinyl-diaminopimelate desuccinylase-like protein